MDDKTYQEQQLRLQNLFFRLRDAVGLQKTRFTLLFYRENDGHHDDGSSTVAEIHPSRPYLNAVVEVYVPQFLDKDDDEAAEILLHELVHYWISPISRYGESKEYDMLEELICTEISLGIASAMKASGEEVGDFWRAEVKKLQKELKKLSKEVAA